MHLIRSSRNSGLFGRLLTLITAALVFGLRLHAAAAGNLPLGEADDYHRNLVDRTGRICDRVDRYRDCRRCDAFGEAS